MILLPLPLLLRFRCNFVAGFSAEELLQGPRAALSSEIREEQQRGRGDGGAEGGAVAMLLVLVMLMMVRAQAQGALRVATPSGVYRVRWRDIDDEMAIEAAAWLARRSATALAMDPRIPRPRAPCSRCATCCRVARAAAAMESRIDWAAALARPCLSLCLRAVTLSLCGCRTVTTHRAMSWPASLLHFDAPRRTRP